MSESSSSSSSGMGVVGALGVLFVALKLLGYINWSWWYVTLPFWGGLALLLIIAAIGLTLVGAAKLIENRQRQQRRGKQ